MSVLNASDANKLARRLARGKRRKLSASPIQKMADNLWRKPPGLPSQVPEGPDEINNLGSFLASLQGIASHIVLVNLLFVSFTHRICSHLRLRNVYNIELSHRSDIYALTVPLVAVLAVKGCVLSVAVNSEHR